MPLSQYIKPERKVKMGKKKAAKKKASKKKASKKKAVPEQNKKAAKWASRVAGAFERSMARRKRRKALMKKGGS